MLQQTWALQINYWCNWSQHIESFVHLNLRHITGREPAASTFGTIWHCIVKFTHFVFFYYLHILLSLWMPVPVAVQSKVYVFDHSPAEIVGSNPTRGMDVCLLWVLCVVRYRSLWQSDHSSRGILPTVARRVWSRNLENKEAKARYQAVKNTTKMGCNARKTNNKHCHSE